MLVQLPLITCVLTLIAQVATVKEDDGEVCNKVCTRTTKCIRQHDDSRCDDIRGYVQVKCTVLCDKTHSSERVNDVHSENIINIVTNPHSDSNKNLKIRKFSLMVEKNNSKDKKKVDLLSLIKNHAQKMNDYASSRLFLALVKHASVLSKYGNFDYNHGSKITSVQLHSLIKRVKRQFGPYVPPYGSYGPYGPYGYAPYGPYGAPPWGNYGVPPHGSYASAGVSESAGAAGHVGGAIGGSIGGGIGVGIGLGGITGGVSGGASGFATGGASGTAYGHKAAYANAATNYG